MIDDDTIRCTKCGEEKLLSEFRMRVYPQHNEDPKYYPRAECKACEKRLAKQLAILRKTAPPQPTRCQCCNGPMYRPRLDHDHVTGEFRGWLCSACNDGFGKFGDNFEGIERAYNYLLLRKNTMSTSETEAPTVEVTVKVTPTTAKTKKTKNEVSEPVETEKTLLLENT